MHKSRVTGTVTHPAKYFIKNIYVVNLYKRMLWVHTNEFEVNFIKISWKKKRTNFVYCNLITKIVLERNEYSHSTLNTIYFHFKLKKILGSRVHGEFIPNLEIFNANT